MHLKELIMTVAWHTLSPSVWVCTFNMNAHRDCVLCPGLWARGSEPSDPPPPPPTQPPGPEGTAGAGPAHALLSHFQSLLSDTLVYVVLLLFCGRR